MAEMKHTPGPCLQLVRLVQTLLDNDPDDMAADGVTVLDVWRREARAALHAAPPAIADVAAERRRQVEAEGWTPQHDDNHRDGALATAAACYVLGSQSQVRPQIWPWHKDWWKPTTRRRDLVKAAALIVAEIERLDRKDSPNG